MAKVTDYPRSEYCGSCLLSAVFTGVLVSVVFTGVSVRVSGVHWDVCSCQRCSLGCLFVISVFTGVSVSDCGVHWGFCSCQQCLLRCLLLKVMFTGMFVPDLGVNFGCLAVSAACFCTFDCQSSVHWQCSLQYYLWVVELCSLVMFTTALVVDRTVVSIGDAHCSTSCGSEGGVHWRCSPQY